MTYTVTKDHNESWLWCRVDLEKVTLPPRQFSSKSSLLWCLRTQETSPPNVNELLNSEGRHEELAKQVDELISRLGHEKLVDLIKSANREEAQEPQQQSQRRCVIV